MFDKKQIIFQNYELKSLKFKIANDIVNFKFFDSDSNYYNIPF
jgi:hypothetical protein